MKTANQTLRIVGDADNQTPQVGAVLVQDGYLSPDQLNIALYEQKLSGGMLGDVLVRLGFLDGVQLARILAKRAGLDYIDVTSMAIDTGLAQQITRATLEKHLVLPLGLRGDVLHLAVADPYDLPALDEIRRHFSRTCQVKLSVADTAGIRQALAGISGFGDNLDTLVDVIQQDGVTALCVAEGTHPVVRVVDRLLTDAVMRRASDIHLEPEGSFVRLRYRIDGALQPVRMLHRDYWPEISHRIKIMAGMNIADQRSMQDGRFTLKIENTDIDFRASIMPVTHGENIVIRVLDRRRAMMPLDQLGFSSNSLQDLDLLLKRPEGIVLVTGPTGCGKTTTLYAMLGKLNSTHQNIMTLEEPVEYQLSQIRQTQIKETRGQDNRGFAFADGVRGILRQDPDVIFIGEVRDKDTASMALRAAMTGHQVFSTLHTNDALGAIPRLFDLGITPGFLSGQLAGVVAQRLVRTLCPHCKTMRVATPEEAEMLCPAQTSHSHRKISGMAEAQAQFGAMITDTPAILVGQAAGCDQCGHTGYCGRTVVAEVLRVTPELDELILQSAPRSAILASLRAAGFETMAEDGAAKVMAGIISPESLMASVDMTRRMGGGV